MRTLNYAFIILSIIFLTQAAEWAQGRLDLLRGVYKVPPEHIKAIKKLQEVKEYFPRNIDSFVDVVPTELHEVYDQFMEDAYNIIMNPIAHMGTDALTFNKYTALTAHIDPGTLCVVVKTTISAVDCMADYYFQRGEFIISLNAEKDLTKDIKARIAKILTDNGSLQMFKEIADAGLPAAEIKKFLEDKLLYKDYTDSIWNVIFASANIPKQRILKHGISVFCESKRISLFIGHDKNAGDSLLWRNELSISSL